MEETKFKYQLIILGNENEFRNTIVETFNTRVQELGLQDDAKIVIDKNNFDARYIAATPTVCIYFGDNNASPDLDILNKLIRNSVFILPIVNDLTNFAKLVPDQLRPINGFELTNKLKIESLVSIIMEGLNLLRLSRRLFISYKRKESRSVAIQLYEYLDQCGFDVFLDTHSIRPGEPFQDELWHRLVDTDIVVLLNTPGFLESKWTSAELAKASGMSIGILQLIWPNHDCSGDSALCRPVYLKEEDFESKDYKDIKSQLTDNTVQFITSHIESLRARSLAARQDNLIKEFMASAKSFNISAAIQPEKFITVERRDGKEVAVIPAVGVPQAFTYNQTEELITRIRAQDSQEALLVYDHRNIREKWQKHINWLDLYLPVKTIRITEIDNWMKKL